MLFSQYYNIKDSWKKDWFDPILDFDTRLFIDPLLIFNSEIPEFKDSKNKIKKFFQHAFERVAQVRKKGPKELEKINSLLSFKEPKEIRLGYDTDGSSGRGIGPDFSRKIRDAIVDFLDYGIEDLAEYIGTFTLIVEGIGPDGISDMVANIIKDDLVKYTQRICGEEKIPMNSYMTNNIGYDHDLDMWRHGKVLLPINPVDKRNPVILVPKAFLIANETIDIYDLEHYLVSIENEELRNQATKLFTKELDIAKIKSALDKDPITAKKLIKSYLESLEKIKIEAYNFEFDPELLYKFELFTQGIKKDLPKKETTIKNKDSLKEFVSEVVMQYKKVIEKKENYWLLYDDKDKPKSEHACQRLFWAIADTMCLSNGDVVLTRENPTGRGPVDFRFNQGYKNKIVLELKHVRSQDIFHGLEGQLPTYIESEESDWGYYVVIKLTPQDTARFERLLMRFENMKQELKNKIVIVNVDARMDNKVSASKV